MGKMGYYAKCRYCGATFHSQTRKGLAPLTHGHARREHPIEYGMAKMAMGHDNTIADDSPWRMYEHYP